MFYGKRTNMISGIAFLILSIAFAITVIFWAKSLVDYGYDYRELTYKEYIVLEAEKKYGSKGSYYYVINVENENNPLCINHIVSAAADEDSIDSLKHGDKIYGYVIELSSDKYSYEIVEIKTENDIILSLDNYNKRDVKNQKTGCWLVGILSAIFMWLSIWSFICIYGKTRVVIYNIKP